VVAPSELVGHQPSVRGFVGLACDASNYGESGGGTYFFTSPEVLTGDFSAGVDFLGTLPYVDRERISSLDPITAEFFSSTQSSANARCIPKG
jgi:hypothetical protein